MDLATIRTQITALCAAITAAASRRWKAASQRLRDCLDAGFRRLRGVAANLLRSGTRGYLILGPARPLPLVMLVSAEGGQAMLAEVSVVVRRHLGSPQAAAAVLGSAPELGTLKCWDTPSR